MGVLHYTFYSDLLRQQTSMYLILPSAVHQGRHPDATLYLLHGGGGNGMDWLRYTSVERYADERNMAVVLPETDGTCFYTDMKYGHPYFTFLTKEIPSVAETLFPVKQDRRHRFAAGLSMGGYGAWKWAFNEPQFFGAVANLSGISFVTEIFQEGGFAHSESEGENGLLINNWGSIEELKGSICDSREWVDREVRDSIDLPALFAGIGTEDFSYKDACRYLAYCREKGLKIEYREMPGKHEWKVWDTLIQEFMDWAFVHAEE